MIDDGSPPSDRTNIDKPRQPRLNTCRGYARIACNNNTGTGKPALGQAYNRLVECFYGSVFESFAPTGVATTYALGIIAKGERMMNHNSTVPELLVQDSNPLYMRQKSAEKVVDLKCHTQVHGKGVPS